MTEIVLDTNYWIEFENNPEIAEAFQECKRDYGFTVLFTRPNFTDLAKSPDQEELSESIAELTDKYIVVEDYESDHFRHSDDPRLLAPDESHEIISQHTVNFDDEKTLRFLFRIFDQDPDESFPSTAKAMREVYQEGGEDMLDIATFWGHREVDDGKVRVDFNDATSVGYVMRRLLAEHAKQVKKEEKVRTNDFLDLRICANAIYASDVFLSESKWVNQDVIPKVCRDLDGVDKPTVISSFAEFFENIPNL